MLERGVSIPKLKIRRWDWLLVIGLVLAPMTGLRIWKVGPAEVLVLLWCLRFFSARKIPRNEILLFFALFLGSMALGTIWCLVIARDEIVLSGLGSWIYLMIAASGMYMGLVRNTVEYNERLLHSFVVVSAIWNIFLFALARAGARSILGAPLWFHYRYSAGGLNPHQVAIVMCAVMLLLAREIMKHRHVLWYLLLEVGCGMVLLATESSTALMAVAVGLVVSGFVSINNCFYQSRSHRHIIILEILIGVLFVVVFNRLLYRFIYDWIAKDSNGLGRLEIFSRIGETFTKAPLFGLGPGQHSRVGNVLIEYHNTYLDVIATSGLVGLYALLRFTLKLLGKLKADNTYLPVVVALYTYGFAGYGLRRLVYWGVITSVYVITEQKTVAKEHESAC